MKRQSKQSKITITSVLCVLLIIGGISTFSSMSVNATTVSYEPPSHFSLIPHDSIEVASDSDFEVFPGSGTAEDPYVIEGYNITTSSSSGIYIYGTTKFFIVRNCYVDAENYGILIWNVTYGTVTIENNTFSNNGWGIYLENDGSTVSDNTCSYNNHYGIYLWYSSGSTVANNTCSYNNWRGIMFETSGSSTVVNNTCNNNGGEGITLSSSGSSTVANNTCNNNGGKSVYLYYSDSSTVANNTCSYNDYGIWLEDSNSSTVANNTCNNNYYHGIYLDSADSSTVANNTCNNNYYYGIWLEGSSFCVVTYNLLQENGEYGIYLHSYSDNTLIHHNNLVDNNLGGTSQAYDDGNSNTWHDIETLEGNYWSDWSGTDSYAIDGAGGANDLYPLDEPTFYLGSPVITEIIHSPSSPTELDTVIINAIVTNPHGVQSVTLHYRVISEIWIEVSMTLVSGDLYNVAIGPFAVSDTVEYYITAVDNSIHHNEATGDNSGLYYSFTIDSSDNTGPAINDIVHSPSSPTELNTISINATVTDASSVQSVTLHYRVNSGTWIEASMTIKSGDIYSVTIGSFAVSDTIEYYISAIDNSVNHNEALENNNRQYYNLFVGSSDVIGPNITSIIHSPSSPTELDTVNINATVISPYGVHSVTLRYRINSGTWQTISMARISGDFYSVTIGSFAVSDTIEYYISALDNSISHNLAINDNSGEYYSFTILSYEDETRTVMFPLLLPAITSLFLGFGIVVQQRRKK